jgi:hypothetical protein
MTADTHFFTTDELAEICRTNSATVRYWGKTGFGPRGVRVGRKVLYPRPVVLAWFRELAARGS